MCVLGDLIVIFCDFEFCDVTTEGCCGQGFLGRSDIVFG